MTQWDISLLHNIAGLSTNDQQFRVHKKQLLTLPYRILASDYEQFRTISDNIVRLPERLRSIPNSSVRLRAVPSDLSNSSTTRLTIQKAYLGFFTGERGGRAPTSQLYLGHLRTRWHAAGRTSTTKKCLCLVYFFGFTHCHTLKMRFHGNRTTVP